MVLEVRITYKVVSFSCTSIMYEYENSRSPFDDSTFENVDAPVFPFYSTEFHILLFGFYGGDRGASKNEDGHSRPEFEITALNLEFVSLFPAHYPHSYRRP